MDECRAWSKFKHSNMVTLLGVYRDHSHDTVTQSVYSACNAIANIHHMTSGTAQGGYSPMLINSKGEQER